MASITNLENFNSDQHFTPKWVFDKLNVKFDLDVAASELETFVPAVKKYTIEDDGLEQNWFGLVWMNPPYSKPTPWVEKFIAHDNGIALLPITRGKWWDAVWASNGVIIPTPYNFKFERPDGVKRDITFRTMFWGLGAGIKILKASNLGQWR
jgi:hypothetical protein